MLEVWPDVSKFELKNTVLKRIKYRLSIKILDGAFVQSACSDLNGSSSFNGVYHDDVIKWKYFRVTDPLWGESTGHRWIPLTEDQWRGPLMFFGC